MHNCLLSLSPLFIIANQFVIFLHQDFVLCDVLGFDEFERLILFHENLAESLLNSSHKCCINLHVYLMDIYTFLLRGIKVHMKIEREMRTRRIGRRVFLGESESRSKG
jgi:hypothetical protein